MTDLWQLPDRLTLGGREWVIRPDYRDILQILAVLERPGLCPEGRLYVALRLFYRDFPAMPRPLHPQAVQAMLDFIAAGSEEGTGPDRKLLDWQQDADLILSDINRAAGCEVRALAFAHWWTFLAWFGAIGEGRLSAVVGIREKLAAGRPLEDWERDYCRRNRHRIRLEQPLTPEEQAEKQRLEALLRGRKGDCD